MATAVLPPLLPTPPRSRMVPLLPTPCLIIPPSSFAPPSSEPGRADSVDRWDAHKKPSGPTSSSERSSDGSGSPPGRASACERWDSKKKSPRGTASSSERGRRTSKSPGRASSCERWDIHKRPPPSRSPSADRCDIHKKPRSQADGLDDGNAVSQTGEEQTEETSTKVATVARTEMVKLPPVFSGASFFASPEPSMLPKPSFLRAR